MQSQHLIDSNWRLALGELEHWKLASLVLLFSVGVAVLVNVMQQVLLKKKNEPPVVFHWFPSIGSTIAYGMDPYGFFFSNRSKYGDIFTFVLLGKKTTVYLGTKGNEFILNGKLKNLNVEEIYSPLTTPVFGQGVVYDCSNAMLMQHKKAPLPQNRRRDRAQKKTADTYKAVIQQKRLEGSNAESDQGSMIENLMGCQYKDGSALTDQDIAHIMIALLMAGQHSSSSTISWILLRLASRPDIQEELLEKQKNVLGINQDGSMKDLRFEDLPRLGLHGRKVKSPMPVPGTPYTIPATHILLATPGTSSRMQKHFPEPLLWESHRWDELPSEDYSNLAPYQSKLDKKDETIVKQQTHHPDYFCTWYLSDVRTHSPLPQLSPGALSSACKCIVNAAPSGTWSQAMNGINKAARMQSFVPAGCPTGFSDFINNEFVDARAFCQFWHDWPRTDSPIPTENVPAVRHACHCVLDSVEPVSQTISKTSSSSKKTSSKPTKSTLKLSSSSNKPVTKISSTGSSSKKISTSSMMTSIKTSTRPSTRLSSTSLLSSTKTSSKRSSSTTSLAKTSPGSKQTSSTTTSKSGSSVLSSSSTKTSTSSKTTSTGTKQSVGSTQRTSYTSSRQLTSSSTKSSSSLSSTRISASTSITRSGSSLSPSAATPSIDCSAVNDVVAVLKSSSATPFCSSYLSIGTSTIWTTQTVTPSNLTATSTTTFTAPIFNITSTIPTSTLLSVTETVTSTPTTAVTVTTTSWSTYSCIGGATTLPSSIIFGATQAAFAFDKRAPSSSFPVPSKISSCASAQISIACKALGLGSATVTSASTTILTPGTVTTIKTNTFSPNTTVNVFSTSTQYTTETITTTADAVTSTVTNTLVLPTPSGLSTGLNYYAYQNTYDYGNANPGFNPTTFKSSNYGQSGFTTDINLMQTQGYPYSSTTTCYLPGQSASYNCGQVTVVMQGYFYAAQGAGTYTISTPNTIDNGLYFWDYDTAFNAYSNSNTAYQAVRAGSGPYTGGSTTLNLAYGEVVPVTIMWVNGGGIGAASMSVTDPSSTTHSSTAGFWIPADDAGSCPNLVNPFSP
ncbi:hypothetical protein KCU95_g12247, partial [Aureobasidium melanogenum]